MELNISSNFLLNTNVNDLINCKIDQYWIINFLQLFGFSCDGCELVNKIVISNPEKNFIYYYRYIEKTLYIKTYCFNLCVCFHDNKNISEIEIEDSHRRLHSFNDSPAKFYYIDVNKNNLYKIRFYKKGLIHRINKPAVINYNYYPHDGSHITGRHVSSSHYYVNGRYLGSNECLTNKWSIEDLDGRILLLKEQEYYGT